MAVFKKKAGFENLPSFDVLPQHLGIIMDGNGRWAKKRALPRKAGHKAGAEVFRRISKLCAHLGIPYVTFYAFSTENWKRPADEVNALMLLFKNYLLEAERDFDESENIAIRFIGEREGLSDELNDLMDRAEKRTADRDGTIINLAVNYGGRLEIVRAVQRLAREGRDLTAITENDISSRIYTAGQPDADLIIRPSGEQRLSNFLLWQSAYSEFWYSDVLWPDFKDEDLYAALSAYEKRNRRFGGTV